MELIAAGLRDHVDDAAKRSAIFRRIAPGLDLDLLHEFAVDGLALDPFLGARRVHAVDQKLVLGRGGSVDRQPETAALRFALIRRDARVRSHDVRVIAVRRQAPDHAARVIRAAGRRRRIDRRRLARHDDLLGGRDLERQVHGGRRAERDRGHFLSRLKPRESCSDAVNAGRQRREPIPSVGTGNAGACPLKVYASGLDGDARHKGTIRVRDPARDRARGLSAPCCAVEQQGDNHPCGPLAGCHNALFGVSRGIGRSGSGWLGAPVPGKRRLAKFSDRRQTAVKPCPQTPEKWAPAVPGPYFSPSTRTSSVE